MDLVARRRRRPGRHRSRSTGPRQRNALNRELQRRIPEVARRARRRRRRRRDHPHRRRSGLLRRGRPEGAGRRRVRDRPIWCCPRTAGARSRPHASRSSAPSTAWPSPAGFELALACDFLVATERARFADTHARVGVMPGWGLTVLLPEADRRAPGPGDEHHRQLRRRRARRSPGAWSTTSCAHDELLPFCRAAGRRHRVQRPGRRAPDARHLPRRAPTPRPPRAGRSRPTSPGSGPATRLDPAEVEARRQAIVERGRGQV